MTKNKNIVLIGMMGAGKTAVAQKLSENHKNFCLIDLDKEIEKSANMTISEIFKQYGEQYFRNLETEIANTFSKKYNQIISTGGGIVIKKENIDILKENGILFYLSAPANVLFERVKYSTNRPLLKSENEHPEKIIKNLMEQREPAYKLADFEIQTEKKTIDEVAEEIIKKYETRL